MAEQADARDLKSLGRDTIRVRFPLSTFKKNYLLDIKTLELYLIANDMWSTLYSLQSLQRSILLRIQSSL